MEYEWFNEQVSKIPRGKHPEYRTGQIARVITRFQRKQVSAQP